MKKDIIQKIKLLALALVLGIGVSYVGAWTGPCGSAPTGSASDCNVDAPLNVGSTAQQKVAGLILNTGNAPTGLIVHSGKVGIGTDTPTADLVVKSGMGSAHLGSWPANTGYGFLSLNGLDTVGGYNFVSSPSDYNLYINRPTGAYTVFRENNNSTNQITIAPTTNNISAPDFCLLDGVTCLSKAGGSAAVTSVKAGATFAGGTPGIVVTPTTGGVVVYLATQSGSGTFAPNNGTSNDENAGTARTECPAGQYMSGIVLANYSINGGNNYPVRGILCKSF